MSTKLIMPQDGPRVKPLYKNQVDAYLKSEYDKSINTWGIPNNLIRTMACLPQLGLTEVDYANSFIFDKDEYLSWPNPDNLSENIVFPKAGFIDRVTKELLINLVSLLNKSRYSITHHTVIGFNTLSQMLSSSQAEDMLLNLVDKNGDIAFEHRNDIYSKYQIESMKIAVKLRGDAHDVSNSEFEHLRELCREQAKEQITKSDVLNCNSKCQTEKYVDAYVDGMLIEMTWCIVHFAGLLNKWFTVIKVMDETDQERDGVDFVGYYNEIVPENIKIRNNSLLSPDGWGGNA